MAKFCAHFCSAHREAVLWGRQAEQAYTRNDEEDRMHDASGKSERVGKALLIEDIKTPDGETRSKISPEKTKISA